MCPAEAVQNVDRGWIIPIGGAEDKENDMTILSKFWELSGGKKAKILIIPTASQLADTGPRYVEIFERLGGKAMYIRVDEREDCFKDRIQGKLKRATGIFITGGNQLRLSTILGGTPVAKLIRSLNANGIHVAGTSAGAAIVTEHMIAGGKAGPTPTEDGATMAPGLGLTNKLIVDQHFRQRDRIGRLMTALSYNPFISGIGIDEDTAAFINPQGIFEVVGAGSITVVDPARLTHSSMHDARHRENLTLIGMTVHVLSEGAKYDINTREAFEE